MTLRGNTKHEIPLSLTLPLRGGRAGVGVKAIFILNPHAPWGTTKHENYCLTSELGSHSGESRNPDYFINYKVPGCRIKVRHDREQHVHRLV
jgi:hypothetical protein